MTGRPDTVGRYHLERLIAHGGMGSLYLARDPAIDRLVAIKFLKEGFDDAAARERFAREARAAGRLQHPNIVTVFDVGEHDTRPFIAMEYVSGETLAQLIERRAVGRLSDKLGILEELCAGLHFAHRAAIVHRDIKPANVMRDESGQVKILDFGIARGGGAGMTRAGDVVGTLNYMAPEQLAGEPVDRRADIYSVGALAYELITNQMAFPGTVQTGVLTRILNSGPVPIESLVPGIDPDVTVMIERAMAREPDARYRDLDALRQDLAVVRTRLLETASALEEAPDSHAETRLDSARIGSGTQLKSSSRASSTPHQSARAISSRPSAQVIGPPRGPKRSVILGIACAMLAIGLVSTLVIDRSPATSPSVPADPPRPQQAQSPAPSLAAPPPASASQPEGVNRTLREEHVSAARVTARKQIAAGQGERALDTLIRGLALDEKDPELNRLVDELTGMARRTATEARAAAVVRGAGPTSLAFRGGQARDREAASLVQAGDRILGIRAAWAAAAFYHKSPDGIGQNASAPPLQPSPARLTSDPVQPPSANPDSQPVLTSPPPKSLQTLPALVDQPSPPPPPTTLQGEPPAVPRDPPLVAQAAAVSAIRETLGRYTQAYQALDGAAVGQMMPSLTAVQLRALDRDFSDYRSYTVEIRDERIDVDGTKATVTCQVVRSFETKNGVTGSNTVRSIFYLRQSGSGWIIERLVSR